MLTAAVALAEGTGTADNDLQLARLKATMRFPSLDRPPFWLFVAGIVLSAPPVFAQSPAEFYRGKTITMIVSSASGGGCDTLSRACQPPRPA